MKRCNVIAPFQSPLPKRKYRKRFDSSLLMLLEKKSSATAWHNILLLQTRHQSEKNKSRYEFIYYFKDDLCLVISYSAEGKVTTKGFTKEFS